MFSALRAFLTRRGKASLKDKPFCLRALVEPSGEGRGWEAICLELDIVAEGSSPTYAIEELIGLIEAQIEFAQEQGQPESIWFPAPHEYWARFYGKAINPHEIRLAKAEVECRSLEPSRA